MEQNKAMFNSKYDQFDYSKDRGATAPKIVVDSEMEQVYDEATTEDISELYTKRKLNEEIARLFKESPWKEKYGINTEEHNQAVKDGIFDTSTSRTKTKQENISENEPVDTDIETKKIQPRKEKKLEKGDMSEMFYYFHDKLLEEVEAGEVDILCTITEFFGLSYSTVFYDILTIEMKIKVLTELKERFGITKELGTRKTRLY